jgi:plastocyanin
VPKPVKIIIKAKSDGAPAGIFQPDPAKVEVGDNVFWSNEDAQAHWPGLLSSGVIVQKFFLPNQVGGKGDVSSNWAPATSNKTYHYACSLHPDDPDERGTIVVS